MSFLKSYYASVSSYLVGENEPIEEKEVKQDDQIQNIPESKSEGWISGIYNQAYNQTGELWSAVRSDLSEFASVISSDAKTVVVKTASGVKSGLMHLDATMTQNLSDDQNEDPDNDTNDEGTGMVEGQYSIKGTIYNMLDRVNKALYIPPEDDDEYLYCSKDEAVSICSRAEARIECLQRDKKTFVKDPTSDSETDPGLGDFKVWKESLNLDDFQTTISELIRTNQNLFEMYAELVPKSVTHEEFWARYFYRVAAIKTEESRREILKTKLIEKTEEKQRLGSDNWDDGNGKSASTSSEKHQEQSFDDDVKEERQMNVQSEVDKDEKKCEQNVRKEDGDNLKMKDHGNVVYVQHDIESSITSSEENNGTNSPMVIEKKDETPEKQEITKNKSKDEKDDDESGWDDDIDIEVTEKDIEMAKKLSNKDVVDDNWDDWS